MGIGCAGRRRRQRLRRRKRPGHDQVRSFGGSRPRIRPFPRTCRTPSLVLVRLEKIEHDSVELLGVLQVGQMCRVAYHRLARMRDRFHK